MPLFGAHIMAFYFSFKSWERAEDKLAAFFEVKLGTHVFIYIILFT